MPRAFIYPMLCGFAHLLTLLLAVGCSPNREPVTDAAPLGTGHFEGTATLKNQPGQSFKLTLELRHPRPGHYDAEVLMPDLPSLSFVTDSADFQPPTLQLTRPGRPGQHLTLTRDGDFWRGTLALDSVQATVLLLRRGASTPTVYQVEKVSQADGPAWLFAPADVGTPSAALVLLPDTTSATAGALWADALAREGLTVLLLPPAADTASGAATTALLISARELLRNTPGTDSTKLGVWAVGTRADAVAQALAAEGAPRTAFFLAQNAGLTGSSRVAYRRLARRKLPVLGLYGGTGSSKSATSLRGVWRGRAVRSYRTAGPDLLVPGPVGRTFAPGLPDEVIGWLPHSE